MPMFEIIQVTAQYSNAVMLAIMPHVADFAKQLDLPLQQPVTVAQVQYFGCSPRTDLVGGRVVLTNGFEFAVLHGRVEMFRTPRSYYELNDFDLLPTFIGPVKLKEKDALKIAHDAIRKLGYSDATVCADRAPVVKPPPKIDKKFVPRYKITWKDPTRGSNPKEPPTSVEFEIDATSGQIQMMVLFNPNTWRPDPKIDVRTQVVSKGAETVLQGGRKITPVSPEYSKAFLIAILPQLSQYVNNAGFPIRLPITTNDVDMSHYSCGIVEGSPLVFLDLKSGARFVYSHGQVIAFYAPDVMDLPGRDAPPFPAYEEFQKKFYGPVNMTTNEVIALVRTTVKKLGYSDKMLGIVVSPRVDGPNWWGTNRITRCTVTWKESNQGPFRVISEVDVATKSVKSLYINDHANKLIWKDPPKLSIPPN
jgi:hypothetical protein